MNRRARRILPILFGSALALSSVGAATGAFAHDTRDFPEHDNGGGHDCRSPSGPSHERPCTSPRDPRCQPPPPSPCDGLNGAADGLCRAYCDRLDCAGSDDRACLLLRVAWRKVSGHAVFPCDAACCECADGERSCATIRSCAEGGCRVVDGCVDGVCPEPQCCQCADGCADASPGQCLRAGCIPGNGDTVCSASGRCETCPCGADCVTADGDAGQCQPPADGSTDVCSCAPLPPACPCGAACTTDAGDQGVCDDVAGTGVCECSGVASTECPCGADCTTAAGEQGVCQDSGGGTCACAPAPPPPPPPCSSCGHVCTLPTGLPGLCQPGASGQCGCIPLPIP